MSIGVGRGKIRGLAYFLEISPDIGCQLSVGDNARSGGTCVDRVVRCFRISKLAPRRVAGRPVIRVRGEVRSIVGVLEDCRESCFGPSHRGRSGSNGFTRSCTRLVGRLQSLGSRGQGLGRELRTSSLRARSTTMCRSGLGHLNSLLGCRLSPRGFPEVGCDSSMEIPIGALRLLVGGVGRRCMLWAT